MGFLFDHLVHFVNDPKKANSDFREYGFHAVEGGFHQNKGTYNTLSYFGLSYIEFLGAYDKQVVESLKHAKHSLRESIVRSSFREGFVRFAIRTNEIERVAERLRAKGLEVSGPERMVRERPDGSELKWHLLYVGEKDRQGPQLPFIIQWDDSDEYRRNDLTENKTIVTHPNGVKEIKHIAIAVENLEETASKWSDLLQLPVGEVFYHEEWNAHCQELQLEGGNVLLASANGDGKIADILKETGEVIFQMNFSGGDRKESFEIYSGSYQINE